MLSAAGLAASAALHLAMIAFLAWSIRPTQPEPDAAPVEVSLLTFRPPATTPRPRPGGARSPARAAPRETAQPDAARQPSPIALPLPAGETVHATDAVRGLLRASIGCDHPAAFHLTGDELDRCDRRARRLGEGQPAYAVRPHDARKLAAFDQAARENEAERRAREGPMATPIPVCSGPGSNFGGGCLSPHYKKATQSASEAEQKSVWH